MYPRFLFEQHLGHALGGHLLIRPGLVSALYEWQVEASAGRRSRATLLREAAPQKVGHRVLKPSVLLDRADLHRAHKVVGQIERRLHPANLYQQAGFLGLGDVLGLATPASGGFLLISEASASTEDFGPFQYATRETLELDPLPCWKHLTPEQRQQQVAALVSEIEGEAAARRERTGVQPLGPAAILAQSPQSQPNKTKRSPAPAVHAATRAVRRELRDAYFWFVAA